MTLLSMVRGLSVSGLRFVVIGGVAATAHGSASITDDLDICYDPADDNREKLAQTLASWEAYLRGVERGLPFVMDERTLRITPVMTLVTSLGNLDVMDRVAGVGNYADVLANSVDVELEKGVHCRVLELPALIRAKRAAGRSKDKQQLPELEALMELTKRKKRS